MPTKPRRRIIGQPVGVSIGSLLADRASDVQLARQAASDARVEANFKEQQDAKRTSSQLGLAQQAYNDYKAGTRTITDLQAALQVILTGATDPELKSTIGSILTSADSISTQRQITDKVNQFNDGTLDYRGLYNAISGKGSGNNIIESSISKSLSDARVTDNTRKSNKLYSQYQIDGNMKNYLGALTTLRSEQSSPVEIEKLTTAINNGEDMAKQLNNQTTFSRWQSKQITDGEAMAYFNGMVASSKTAQEAQAADAFLKQITAKSNGAANDYMAALAASQKTQYDNFIKDAFNPGIAKAGSQAEIRYWHDQAAAMLKRFAAQGSPASPSQTDLAESLKNAGTIAARNFTFGSGGTVMTGFNKTLGGLKDLKSNDDKARLLAEAARMLWDAENGNGIGGFPQVVGPSPEQAASFAAGRNAVGGQIKNIRVAEEKKVISDEKSGRAAIQDLFSKLTARDSNLTNPDNKWMKQQGLLGADGKPSLEKFTQWIVSNPEQNVTQAYNQTISGTTKEISPTEVKTGQGVLKDYIDSVSGLKIIDVPNDAPPPNIPLDDKGQFTGDLKEFNPGGSLYKAPTVPKIVTNNDSLNVIVSADVETQYPDLTPELQAKVVQSVLINYGVFSNEQSLGRVRDATEFKRNLDRELRAFRENRADTEHPYLYTGDDGRPSLGPSPAFLNNIPTSTTEGVMPPRTPIDIWQGLDQTPGKGMFGGIPRQDYRIYPESNTAGVMAGGGNGVVSDASGNMVQPGQFFSPGGPAKPQVDLSTSGAWPVSLVRSQDSTIPQFDLSRYLSGLNAPYESDPLAGGDVRSEPPNWNWNQSPTTVEPQLDSQGFRMDLSGR